MKHLVCFVVVVGLSVFHFVYAQKRWDGGAGTNRWSDAANWTSNTVPVATDDVLLDNLFMTSSYNVIMPSVHGTVRTITIQPQSGRNIELVMPPANLDVPGFTVSGPGYGMNIHAGGIFRNSSGSGSGAAILVRDSIRIFDNGRYIHNTTGGHVNAVQVLSRAPGTEFGIFEIDIPAASATISLSERVFGRLILRSTAANGNVSYTAAGTSRCVIRGDFEIDPGVDVTLNFEDTIFVHRHFTQRGGTFNFGSTPRSAALYISGDFNQLAGAEIGEFGPASHSIIMGGRTSQIVNVNGFWFNEVAFVKTTSNTILLRSNLRLPYRFELRSGYVATTFDWQLILRIGCELIVDSLAQNTAIAGPMTKEGIVNSSILIPVGSFFRMYWIRLEQATGGFMINYRRFNPRDLSNALGPGIHHISEIEYWDVTGFPQSSAQIKISFNDPHSGGVTDLSTLRIARLVNGTWQNVGVSGTGGTAGSRGWVRSNVVTWGSTSTSSFALASSSSIQNPLPLESIQLSVKRVGAGLLFNWQAYDKQMQPALFEIQHSSDGRSFNLLTKVNARPHQENYKYLHKGLPDHGYFRLGIKTTDARWIFTRVIRIEPKSGFTVGSVSYVPGSLSFFVNADSAEDFLAEVRDVQGRLIFIRRFRTNAGATQISLPVHLPRSGIYLLRLRGRRGQQVTRRFVVT